MDEIKNKSPLSGNAPDAGDSPAPLLESEALCPLPEDCAVPEEPVLADPAFEESETEDITLLHIPMISQELEAHEDAIAEHPLRSPIEAPDIPSPEKESEKQDVTAMFQHLKVPQRSTAPKEKTVPQHQPRTHAVRKGRPKRKKGVGLLGIPHLIATVIWLMIIVFIGASLGRMLWVCAADALAFGRESQKVTVTISSHDTNSDIAEKLHEAGLIRYPGLFELYADLAVDEGEIVPGTYELGTIYDYMALVVQMSHKSSSREEFEVLIPEGLNCRQIFELLEQNKICTVAELEEYAANGELDDYWFLEGVKRGDKYCLEGFLFPDTYKFYVGGSARHTLEKMLSGFEYRFTEEYNAMLPALNERLSAMMRANGCSEEYIAANQLTLRDVVTVASLIEEETASTKESPMIASVIYNRLTQDQEYERYLGIDASIIYALGEHKDVLTAEDLALDSPYNTRLYAGLTPGPISNPGLESLLSALDPEESDYYYYVLDPESGLHDFSKTLEEHDKKKERYAAYESEAGQ